MLTAIFSYLFYKGNSTERWRFYVSICIFSFLNVDIILASSYTVNISQLVCSFRFISDVSYFNYRNHCLCYCKLLESLKKHFKRNSRSYFLTVIIFTCKLGKFRYFQLIFIIWFYVVLLTPFQYKETIKGPENKLEK